MTYGLMISFTILSELVHLTPSPLLVINVKKVPELLSYEKLWHAKLVGTKAHNKQAILIRGALE